MVFGILAPELSDSFELGFSFSGDSDSDQDDLESSYVDSLSDNGYNLKCFFEAGFGVLVLAIC